MITGSRDAHGLRALTPGRALVVVAVVFAVYGIGLLQVPFEPDELLLYSSVARAPHPFGYLAGDIGLGNYLYRPLHAGAMWVSYRLFGVWALPDQLVSLVLHAGIGLLLLDLLLRANPRRDPRLMVLLTLVAMVSPYTTSGVTWLADRPQLFVALALLLAVRHLYASDRPARLAMVTALSVLALLSKESGVIVPAMVAFYGWRESRRSFMVTGAALMAIYMVLRVALFGADALAYSESGVLFGIWHYDDSMELHGLGYAAMLLDNVIKHGVAIGLPVFDYQGELLLGRPLWVQAPLWLSTAGLVVVTATRRPSRAQLLALLVIGLNAVIHAAVYRQRALYVTHLAFVVYLAGSGELASPRHRRLFVAFALVLLAFSAFRVEQWVVGDVLAGYEQIASPEFGAGTYEGIPAIDPAIVSAIKQTYAP
jgi:hypothetical protein